MMTIKLNRSLVLDFPCTYVIFTQVLSASRRRRPLACGAHPPLMVQWVLTESATACLKASSLLLNWNGMIRFQWNIYYSECFKQLSLCLYRLRHFIKFKAIFGVWCRHLIFVTYTGGDNRCCLVWIGPKPSGRHSADDIAKNKSVSMG